MINPGGFFMAVSCFLSFYYSRYGDRRDINRTIWYTILFLPLGIVFIMASLLSLSYVGDVLFEFGAGLLGWTWISIIIRYYKLGKVWNKFSRNIRRLFYVICHILRVFIIILYGFKVCIIFMV
ncbi:hypothetical protein [Veillonella intestinalis]|uniref:hypothetical protein n=1 Tax=Veillonella intestinalis TaxID=2941341 RepID=UPI00203DC464|nr:hypothetical protein [Veillonella intestinalis]